MSQIKTNMKIITLSKNPQPKTKKDIFMKIPMPLIFHCTCDYKKAPEHQKDTDAVNFKVFSL